MFISFSTSSCRIFQIVRAGRRSLRLFPAENFSCSSRNRTAAGKIGEFLREIMKKATGKSASQLLLGKGSQTPTRKSDARSSTHVENVAFKVLPSPKKSERDHKEYKVIRLTNGLTACLISEPADNDVVDSGSSSESDSSDVDSPESSYTSEEDEEQRAMSPESDNENRRSSEARVKMAAAGLCVGVGSFSDPADIPGMAHLLEHMVFMGSKKFPEENDFDQYISKRGGSDNASTDVETTTFYFECLEKYLYKSLDKFAQFFIEPLMKRESMTREREAIDSEFQVAIPSNAYRKEQLLAVTMNPDVPINQFSWGNLITLKERVADEQLYAALHAFRKRHYSAHRMTLCIQARLPLDTLQTFVLDCFKDVPTNGLPPIDFRPYSARIYDTPQFNKIYYVIPNKNAISVDLTWVLPSLLKLYKSKPHQYVSTLLGDEGKGSLISELRRRVWALAIFSGNGETGFEHNTMYAFFTMTIVLTQAGLENLYEVIGLVFGYINMLKKLGPQERIFKEIQLIDETSFRFADESPAVETVENVAENMHYYPSEDYLTGPDIYTEYNPNGIQMVLNYMRPDKVNIMVLTKDMPDDIVCDQLEPWFQTQYTTKDIPNAWLEKWANMQPLDEFNLPEPNPYITSDFTILACPADHSRFPRKLIDNESIELWYRFDEKFANPMAYYYFYLASAFAFESTENACMMDMFINLLMMQLTEEAYRAQVAGLEYAFSLGDRGLVLQLTGYNEKLPILLDLLTSYMRSVRSRLNEEMFNAVKEGQVMAYYNKLLKPSSLCKDMRLKLLLDTYHAPIDKHAAIARISFEMMQQFSEQLMDTLFVQALVQGNVCEETVIEVANKFVRDLAYKPLLSDNIPKVRVVQLPTNEHCMRVQSFNKNDTNSYITNYYQVGPFAMRTHVIIELLMMIIEEPLFDALRTKEQLGYNVYCNLRDTFGIHGYSLTVNTQASKFSTSHIDVRIEAFIARMQKTLKRMSEKKLTQFKRDLVKLKQVADLQLKDEVGRNWIEIVNRDYMFDRLQHEINAIDELKIGELRKFWEDHNVHGNKSNLRKLSVQVVGCSTPKDCDDMESDIAVTGQNPKSVYKLNLYAKSEKQTKHGYFVQDIDAFKKSLFLYPPKKSL